MKITKALGDNKFEIRVDPIEKNHTLNYGACHDYVLFSYSAWLYCDDGVSVPTGKGGSTNIVEIPSSVQVPIRMMGEVILPSLNESKYLKEEHWSKYGLWNESPISNWADSKTLQFYDKGQNKFVEISRELYEKLKS